VRGQQHAGNKLVAASTTATPTPTPSLSEITAFFRHIYHKSKLNVDCIILSLIYVERLLKDTQGQLRPTAKNWKSLLMASLILASKVRAHTCISYCCSCCSAAPDTRMVLSMRLQARHGNNISACNSVGVILNRCLMICLSGM
jgi:Cyclin, N-terminal domain